MNNKIYNKNRIIIIIVAIALLIGNAYFMMKSYTLSKALAIAQADAISIHQNEKIINFTRLFIEKVLNADKEVDFVTRLQLENAVVDLKDGEVSSGWQKFTESKTDSEAAENVKDLLEILLKKAI